MSCHQIMSFFALANILLLIQTASFSGVFMHRHQISEGRGNSTGAATPICHGGAFVGQRGWFYAPISASLPGNEAAFATHLCSDGYATHKGFFCRKAWRITFLCLPLQPFSGMRNFSEFLILLLLVPRKRVGGSFESARCAARELCGDAIARGYWFRKQEMAAPTLPENVGI